MSIGIVALSEDREEPETQFYVTDADGDDNDWQAFVSKCNALLKTSAKSHAALVWAAIKYGTTSEKVAEREEFEDCVRAFMGEGWDLDCLGTWKEVKHHYEFNRMVIDKDIEQVFIFVYQEYTENKTKNPHSVSLFSIKKCKTRMSLTRNPCPSIVGVGSSPWWSSILRSAA